MRAPLNLARRPVRNERLPTLLLVVANVLLLVFSARHAVEALELRRGAAGDVESQVAAMEQETRALGQTAASLRRGVDHGQLQQWGNLKRIVDRRAFSWTGLFAALEEVLPPGVRLVSVAPNPADEGMQVSLTAVARDVKDGFELLKALQASPQFRDAFLLNIGNKAADGVTASYSVRYLGPQQAGGHK